MSDKLASLKEIGFTPAGCWKLCDNALDFELGNHGTDNNVLYAFVVDDEVMYVGKTVLPLRARMAGYKTPGPTQSTNQKNNAKIREVLAQGQIVKILVLPDNGLVRFGSFHVNLAAGLEDSLIHELMPSWNGGKKELANQSLQPTELT
jgi:hypothetical protein